MWRSISRPASAAAVAGLLVMAGCGGGDQTTSAGAVQTVPATSVVPTTATTVPAPTTTSPPCSSVSFSSNADDKASDIGATGLSCTDAEALVRKVGPQVSGDGGPGRVESDGFACSRTSARSGDHGPASATFECISGAKKVVFVRT